MSDKKPSARVYARDVLSNFSSILTDRTPEAAAKFNNPSKKEILLGWVNGIIKVRGNNLVQFSDLRKGSDLIVLLEILTNNRLTTGYRQPGNFVEMANNLEIFLKFMRHNNLDTTGITAMDIYEGKFEKVLYVLVLLAKTYTEQSDNNKVIEAFHKSNKNKQSAKQDKKISTLELKLEQATLDHIYQLAAVYQVELEKEETQKKKDKEKKKLTAMALLSQTEVAKIPLSFTVHLPDGTKDVRDFDATLSLVEVLESICTAKHWLMDNYIAQSMGGKDIDMDFVLGEIKEKEIKLVPMEAPVEEEKQPEVKAPKTEKRIKRVDKGRAIPSSLAQILSNPTPLPVKDKDKDAPFARRAFTRQNSYIAIKAWNPDEDEDEIESKKRVIARDHAIAKAQLKDVKSPLVIAMEKEHKAMMEKLNLEGVKVPPMVPPKTTKLADINLRSLEMDLKNLNTFESLYGGNHDYNPENYFKDLL